MTTMRVRCPHCGKIAEQSDKPFVGPGADRQTHIDPAIEAKARAAAIAAAPPAPPAPPPEPAKTGEPGNVRGYMTGVSASPFHSAVMAHDGQPFATRHQWQGRRHAPD